MLAQKMKTTACQVNTNGRLTKMLEEKAYKSKNIVVCVQQLNILEYWRLFAITRYSVE